MSTDSKIQALTTYTSLQEKVSAMFSQIFEKHKSQMACGRGCASCCVHGLTISNIEAAAISQVIQQRDPQKTSPAALYPGRCEFLDENMNCSIYEVRPLICRSHGAPVVIKNEEGERQFDVCPLNFEGLNINELPLSDIMNIDTINVLLTLLNKQYDSENSGERWPLNPRTLSQFKG